MNIRGLSGVAYQLSYARIMDKHLFRDYAYNHARYSVVRQDKPYPQVVAGKRRRSKAYYRRQKARAMARVNLVKEHTALGLQSPRLWNKMVNESASRYLATARAVCHSKGKINRLNKLCIAYLRGQLHAMAGQYINSAGLSSRCEVIRCQVRLTPIVNKTRATVGHGSCRTHIPNTGKAL